MGDYSPVADCQIEEDNGKKVYRFKSTVEAGP